MTKSNTTSEPAAASSSPTPFIPKVLKQISTNLLKLRVGSEVFLKITAAMKVAPMSAKEAAKPEGERKQPPTLIDCVDLPTGETVTIIAGATLKDLLSESYPGDTYVGKGFWIKVIEKKDVQGGGGRSYNVYDVKEIAV